MVRSLRAIFFDIDDTLFSTSQFAARARRNSIRAMQRCGLRGSTAHLLRELQEVIGEFSSNYEHHFEKLLVRLSPRAYPGVNPALLTAAGVIAYHDTKFRELAPFPGVIPLLRRLQRTRLIRGVITAGLEIKQAEKLLRLGVYPYLTPRAIFISDQIGISKPNVKLYQRACEASGVRPRQAMYVGDNPLTDIDPAHRLGMVTVRFRGPGRHGGEEGRTKADFEVRSFAELGGVLRRGFGVPV